MKTEEGVEETPKFIASQEMGGPWHLNGNWVLNLWGLCELQELVSNWIELLDTRCHRIAELMWGKTHILVSKVVSLPLVCHQELPYDLLQESLHPM